MEFRTARIQLQHPFCCRCGQKITTQLGKIKAIKNVKCYPSEQLVVFGFNTAFQISEVLNSLIQLGFPPKGETTVSKDAIWYWAACHHLEHINQKTTYAGQGQMTNHTVQPIMQSI